MALRDMINIHSGWLPFTPLRHGIHYLVPTILNQNVMFDTIQRLLARFLIANYAAPAARRFGRLPRFCSIGTFTAEEIKTIYDCGINPIVQHDRFGDRIRVLWGMRFINAQGVIDEMVGPNNAITDSFRQSVVSFGVTLPCSVVATRSLPIAPVAANAEPESFVMQPIHYALSAKPKRIGLITDLSSE